MTTEPRADTVLTGAVVLAAHPDGRLETAEAVGIADGRVVSGGRADEVRAAAAAGARHLEFGDALIVPGLHDFHLHLVGLARSRREVRLGDAANPDELVRRVASAARSLPGGAWLLGGGWREEQLSPSVAERLRAVVGERLAWLGSHDGHSVWASPAALGAGGIDRLTADLPGGRIERDADGEPNGILREAAANPVTAVRQRLSGADLAEALDETLAQLAAYGITGATDAGDYDTAGGSGSEARYGDSFSNLLAADLGGRLRLTVDIPAEAIAIAAADRRRSGMMLDDIGLLRFGWAKLYADGALGSRTAALFELYSCGEGSGTGILRVDRVALEETIVAARQAGIAMAIHAIGDRAVATVLDAVSAAPARRPGAPPDRLEHAQLVRAADRSRFAALDLTASMQPLHAPSDRATVESCWAGCVELAYPWGSLARVGARLAFGSDAPIEPPDPWLGTFAAVHRRYPHEAADWTPAEAIHPIAALSAYTVGPASAFGRGDEGHLRPGAVADLAVLDVDLATLRRGDERLSEARSVLTLVGGREVHRA
jgi:predicted amidohydrolase YtcJ